MGRSKGRDHFLNNTIIRASNGYAKRFRVIKKFIEDSEVYKCYDLKDNKTVVIKAEEIGGSNDSRLEKEWHFYKNLKQYQDFNIALDLFVGIDHRFLVLEERGIDLREYTKQQRNANNWTVNHLNRCAVQMIEGLEKCHSLGIIHLDPKPNNYVLESNNNSNKIYLIDFDCGKQYITSDGQHIPFSSNLSPKQIFGNRAYISINGHNCEEQSRRDDMIFLGFSLIWMARDGLPWNNKKSTDYSSLKEYYQFIKNQKLEYYGKLHELCLLKGKGCDQNGEVLYNLIDYMKYCTELKFLEKPNYSYLKSLFE